MRVPFPILSSWAGPRFAGRTRAGDAPPATSPQAAEAGHLSWRFTMYYHARKRSGWELTNQGCPRRWQTLAGVANWLRSQRDVLPAGTAFQVYAVKPTPKRTALTLVGTFTIGHDVDVRLVPPVALGRLDEQQGHRFLGGAHTTA